LSCDLFIYVDRCYYILRKPGAKAARLWRREAIDAAVTLLARQCAKYDVVFNASWLFIGVSVLNADIHDH